MQAEADLEQAKQAIAAARATVASSEARIREMEAGVNRASAERDRWQAEVIRADDLLSKNIYDRQTRDEARNQFRASEAAVNEARAKVASAQALYQENVAKLHKAEADRDAVAARLGVTKADRQQQKDWLGYAELRAPYDGIVTMRNVHTGAFLQSSNSGSNSKTSDPLFVVMRTDLMRVTVQVPEKDAVLVKQAADKEINGVPMGQGTPAVVRLPALPGRDFSGTVTRDSWSLDEAVRTLRTEIFLKNTTGELHVNMYADVVITTRIPNTLALPSTAVLTDGNHDYCFEVKDGKAVRTRIQVGMATTTGFRCFTSGRSRPRTATQENGCHSRGVKPS